MDQGRDARPESRIGGSGPGSHGHGPRPRAVRRRPRRRARDVPELPRGRLPRGRARL